MEIEPNSTDHFKLNSKLELQEYADKFVIRSPESPTEGFSVSRFDGKIEKLNGDMSFGNPSKVSTIYGVAGTIRLLAGSLILLITSRKEVGNYLGFPVFHVMSMKFLSCNEASKHLTRQEADPRFVWNKNLLEELIENKLDGFIVPLLQGSFQTGHLKLKNSPATIALISRRCTRCLGTQMWRRGAYLEGDTAKFIET